MPISVLSLNLWHDAGPWPERARRIRAWIDRLDPDLVGFQEVLSGDGIDLAAEILEDRLPHRDFARASPFWREDAEHLAFGNAVATRWPHAWREELALPDSGDGETRAALSVGVEVPGLEQPLCFTSTHLNWKLHQGAVREAQVVALAEHVLSRRPRGGFPPILVGDFNAEPDSSEIRFLCGLQSLGGRSVFFHDAWRVAGDGGPGVTWSNQNPYAREALEPNRRIDYVFTGYPLASGAGHLRECRVVCDEPESDVWPSDHFGVFAVLES